jgi:hypothetical protein
MSLTKFIQTIEQSLVPESISPTKLEINLSEQDSTRYRYYDPKTPQKITECGQNFEEKLDYSLELVRQGLVFENQPGIIKKPIHSCSTLLCTPQGLGGVISTYFDSNDIEGLEINDSLLILPKHHKKLQGRNILSYPIKDDFIIKYGGGVNLDRKITEIAADEIVIKDPDLDSLPSIPKRLIRLYNSFTYRNSDLDSKN